MSKTIASQCFNDPRIQQAKDLLHAVMQEHKEKITAVKGADSELAKSYEELLKEFGQNRGGNLYYPYLGSGFGNGALVELEDGSVKYDFITGIGVHYMGHNHPKLLDATVDASLVNTTMNGHLQQNSDSAKLVKVLLDQANKYGANFNHCFLTSSGAMANENAMKIMFQKRSPAYRVFAFEKNFMGRTLAISNVTDKAAYRAGLPKTIDVDYIPFYDHKDHQGSIDRAVAAMKKQIARFPEKHAMFSMEMIQGEAGSWPGHVEFFHALGDVCKENNISILVDEVQTFGRTTELYAFQYFKMDKYADTVTVGKNSQVCATLFREDHRPAPGLISQTFTSSSSAIRASLAILDEIINNDYLGENGKIMKMHNHFKSHLETLNKKYPEKIEGPHGLGAMVAMTVFKGDMEKSKAFTNKLYHNGVLGFIAGANPTRVRFLMPMGAVTTEDIDNVAKLIEQTLQEI